MARKRVVSLSLGSSHRDHATRVSLGDESVEVVRMGTDGDIHKLARMIAELDGEVAAIGLGGLDRFVTVGRKRYEFRQAKALAQFAKVTPIVDGSGFKDRWEPMVVAALQEKWGSWQGRKVLVTCAVDRFGLAQAFAAAGADLVLGDLIFEMGLPLPLRSLKSLERLAAALMPFLVRLPVGWLNPPLPQEFERSQQGAKWMDWAEVIAGDFHSLNRHLAQRIEGKIVVTNTLTSRDRVELRERGARAVISTTPIWDGRSFGANVMEALLVAVSGGPLQSLSDGELARLMKPWND